MDTARLNSVFSEVVDALREVIRRHRVTEEEWRLAAAWLTEAGTQANEIPLLLDVLFAVTVDDVGVAAARGTENSVEGPFYVPGAPLLSPPYRLPMRADEPGERLIVSGGVRSGDGTPLPGALLDVWQISADGGYSHFHPGFPEYNLRGRLRAGDDGRFEFETVVPPPYQIPTDGATGRLLAALGRTAWRPAHVHLKLSCDGHRPLTTQVYVSGDPWLDRDVVGAVKASLVADVVRDGDGPARLAYDFVLDPVAAPAAV